MSTILGRQVNAQDPVGASKAQTNCGFGGPCLTFNEEQQLVSTSGENQWIAPAPGDIRGPCPGLNAAANHGYLPRNGIASIEQSEPARLLCIKSELLKLCLAVTGLGAAYGLGPRISAVLAAYAIAIDGNVLEQVWSIGGPLPSEFLGGLIGTGQGLSYSHNNYEGDGSIGRDDAYINHGDAHSLDVAKFEAVYQVGQPDDRYTLDKFRQRFHDVQQASIASNPYYFTGLFSTVVVVPAAYNFVINLMSNHSAEEPSGYLDGNVFKQFFGVSGEPGSFVWNRGQERIPDEWYKRPTDNDYEAQDVAGDVLVGYLAYPNTLLIGGNTGKVNTFTGVDPGNFTNGVYNAQTLAEGDNFACFAFQLLQNGIPDALNNDLGAISQATALVNNALSPVLGDLSCPALSQFDQGLFNKFPGYKYSPTGPDTNY
ncbi:MAG: hypothetical protein Q9159_006754 [Coniocarpon cinnabarinum]